MYLSMIYLSIYLFCSGNYESIMLVNEHDILVPMPMCNDGTCSECKQQVLTTYLNMFTHMLLPGLFKSSGQTIIKRLG